MWEPPEPPHDVAVVLRLLGVPPAEAAAGLHGAIWSAKSSEWANGR